MGNDQKQDLAQSGKIGRRSLLATTGGLAGVALVSRGEPVGAQPPAARTTVVDEAAIDHLIQRERQARDAGNWAAMAGSYHPDSHIDVSWFQGDGKTFVARTRAGARPDNLNFHQMSPAVVTMNGDRAIALTPCTLQGFMTLGGIDINVVGHVNLFWRALPLDGQWLIAGLRVAYVRDLMIPVDPGRLPVLDQARLASYRPSYRYLSYILDAANHPPRLDLPGVDKPETVVALRDGEQRWLHGS